MLNVSLNEMKQIEKMRGMFQKGMKGYENICKERWLSALSESELVISKKNFDDERLNKVKEDFNK